MFLSKVFVDSRMATDVYRLHRTIWALFPDQPEASRDFLFRAERGNWGGPLPVLLQSSRVPKPAAQARILATRDYEPVLAAGDRLKFLVVANPVKTLAKDVKGRSGVRVPLLQEEEQRNWLERKMAGAAELLQLEVANLAPFFFTKGEGRGRKTGKIQAVRFSGLLRVSDPAAFDRILQQGIGPAKSFGCGMMSIARA